MTSGPAAGLSYAPYGVLKFVPAHQLEAHTQEGWKLLEVYTVKCQVPINVSRTETVPPYPASGSSGYYNPPSTQTVMDTEIREESSICCLIALSEDSALKTLSDKLSAKEDDLKKSLADLDFLKVSTKTANDTASAAKLGEERVKSSLTVALADLDSVRAKNRAMEADLAVIRTAVGDLKFKEILGQKPA